MRVPCAHPTTTTTSTTTTTTTTTAATNTNNNNSNNDKRRKLSPHEQGWPWEVDDALMQHQTLTPGIVLVVRGPWLGYTYASVFAVAAKL